MGEALEEREKKPNANPPLAVAVVVAVPGDLSGRELRFFTLSPPPGRIEFLSPGQVRRDGKEDGPVFAEIQQPAARPFCSCNRIIIITHTMLSNPIRARSYGGGQFKL